MRTPSAISKEALRQVWPEYPLASEMIDCVEKHTDWHPDIDRKEIDPLTARWLAEESGKLYKAIFAGDHTGTVYLITNPATWAYRGDTRIRPKPRVLGKMSEFVKDGPKGGGVSW